LNEISVYLQELAASVNFLSHPPHCIFKHRLLEIPKSPTGVAEAVGENDKELYVDVSAN
jgi:hypothetical protein